MNFLPQVSSEDLNERDFERWNLAVHEDSCQVKLNLETNVNLEKRKKQSSVINGEQLWGRFCLPGLTIERKVSHKDVKFK